MNTMTSLDKIAKNGDTKEKKLLSTYMMGEPKKLRFRKKQKQRKIKNAIDK